jgi:pimeloyl-ACP methyl ester carboxylesterase
VGYSKGALLIRKAFVYGHGRVEDLEAVRGEARSAMAWVRAVERIVLLAGMNRGWTLRHRPAQMPIRRFWALKLAKQLGRVTGTGRLMRRCESGEPFVADLRIQWLDLMRGLAKEMRPTVIQLLGDRDDTVSSADQRDLTVAKEFIWVRVNNTGHPDIVDFTDPISGEERRSKIKKALGNTAEIESLRRVSTRPPDNEDPLVSEVVVVLHGIRDMGPWTSQFELPLQQAYHLKNPKEISKIVVTWPSYGYFGMGPFLLWADRQTNVRWFMDELTEIKARFPKLKKVHFIGHSNGTYVLASALKKYKTLKVGNIVFAGCVLPRNFDWVGIGSQFDKIRNYVASRDWVVAWFPRLFEFPLFSFINKDIGSAGFSGFEQARGNEFETRFLDGGHSIALDPRNIDSIVQFVINDAKVEEPTLFDGRGPSWGMEYSSKLCVFIWLMIIAGFSFLYILWRNLFELYSPTGIEPYHVQLAAATFAGLVIALLRNI